MKRPFYRHKPDNKIIRRGTVSYLVVCRRNGEILKFKFDTNLIGRVRNVRWYAGGGGYALGSLPPKGKKVFMHHLVLGKRDGFVVDHINRNIKDNRLSNLRFVTRAQNLLNRSSITGVTFTDNRWVAQTIKGGKHITIGRFKSKRAAMMAYKKARKELYGI